jgi:hypothetical protein
MSTLMQTAERIAAAGCSRAVVSPDVAGVVEYSGSAAFAAAAFRGWGSNPTQGMPQVTKRHLTPAPRPEDGSP